MPLRVMHVFGGHVRSGVESHVLTLSKGLQETGVEVVLAPLAASELFRAEVRQKGFSMVNLGKRRRYDITSIPKLARLIRDHRVDIVHSHAINGAFYAHPAGWLAGVPGQVSTFHAYTKDALRDVYGSAPVRGLAHQYNLLLCRLCDGLIAVNPSLMRELIDEGMPGEKIVCIPNTVDFFDYDPSAFDAAAIKRELNLPLHVPVIGTAGRLAPVKNLHVFLLTAKELLDRGWRARFVLIGDGLLRKDLEASSRQLGIEEHVVFTGWRVDIARMLSVLDIFALTSLRETGPIAALEAMALEKPVVASDVECIAVAVRNGETGLLARPNDPSSFADALSVLLRNKERLCAWVAPDEGL